MAEHRDDGFIPSAGDEDDHVLVQRLDRVKVYVTSGATILGDVASVTDVGLLLDVDQVKTNDDLEIQINHFGDGVRAAVPWTSIHWVWIDPPVSDEDET